MDQPKARILVVDDEASVRISLVDILLHSGYAVDSAADGIAAIDAIRSYSYDLVLTDLKMPGCDGLAILREVQNWSPGTATIMMTGYATVSSAVEAISLGAIEYIMKPAEVTDLLLAIERTLERKRLSEIAAIYRLSRRLAQTHDLDAICKSVSEAAQRLHPAASQLVCFDSQERPLSCEPRLSALLADPQFKQALVLGAAITPRNHVSSARQWALEAGVESYAFVPGLSSGRLLCVLYLRQGDARFEFTTSLLLFLETLMAQAALALERAHLIQELRRGNHELAAANQKLLELDHLKSQFLSLATHELRTPLSIILGYTSMVCEELRDRAPEVTPLLQESTAACKRLIRLVNSMLDISQMEAGRLPMQFLRCDLRRLVIEFCSLFEPEAHRRGIQLAMQIPEKFPEAEVDPERIQQVLTNLLGNSLKYTPAGGHVKVELAAGDNKTIELAVSDTGCGIAADDQPFIFDEFFRVRQSQADSTPEGTGLGLAITRRIVHAHGGDIECSSRPGSGSTFLVRLPLHRKQEYSQRYFG